MSEPQVCTYCLADLTAPSSQLQVDIVGDMDGSEFNRLHAMSRGQLHEKRDVMLRAFAEGWRVQLNAWIVGPAITTWRGDPICQVHLFIEAEHAREPQTVRMAQWGPRRGGPYR